MSQQINLFNPIFRKQKKYFSSLTMLQALAIIGFACLLLAGDAARRLRALQEQAAATDALLVARQQKLTEFRVQFAPRQKSAGLAAEIVAAQDELAMLASATATIERGGFGDTHGFSGYFRAFARQSVAGLWLTGVDIDAGPSGAQLGVQGNTLQAELVPQYMQRLATEAVMRGKAFSSLNIGGAATPAPAVGATAPVPAPAAVAPAFLHFSLQSSGAAAPQSLVAK